VKNGNERVLRVLLAQPRGFCAGVERAIEIVQRALDLFGPPVYVRHEIVHNKHVVESLRAKGAVFVENLSDIPEGAVTIFSAHGVPEAVQAEAERRKLPTIDATCPLVSKVHKEGQNHALKGREVILIGHEGHPEVEGTRGRIPGGVHLVSSAADVAAIHVRNPEQVAYVTQTTLSVDETRDIIAALKQRFPQIVGPDVKDICYATQNRQTGGPQTGGRGRHPSSGRRPQQLELQPLREIGTEMKTHQLPDRRLPAGSIRAGSTASPRWESRPGRRPGRTGA